MSVSSKQAQRGDASAPAAGTADPPVPAPESTARSWARARRDIIAGIKQRELWGHLGWQDITRRYRRSVLGPFWITLSMAVTATGLGFLYSQLLGAEIGAYLPYLMVGFMVWQFLLGCMTDGTGAFISNANLITHLPAPRTVYVLRTVWRQALYFAHHLIVYVTVLIVFSGTLFSEYKVVDQQYAVLQPGFGWAALMAIPAFLLITLNAVWVVMLLGIISTRFRDIPQVVNSLTTLMFFMTPIIWSTDVLRARFEGDINWRMMIAELNPLYHFVEILRAPLIGNQQDWHHWAVVAGITVVGWALAFTAMRNYRARVSYWV